MLKVGGVSVRGVNYDKSKEGEKGPYSLRSFQIVALNNVKISYFLTLCHLPFQYRKLVPNETVVSHGKAQGLSQIVCS